MISTESHPRASGPPSSTFDVVFVGAGISNTFTLIELLTRLEQQRAQSARVLLIDRYGDFFAGVPYGKRSGDLGLIISRTSDFLPQPHFGAFSDWLGDNRDTAFERFFAVGGEFVENWRRSFWHQVEAGDIADLYLPRYLFGLYFAMIAERAIDRAHRLGVASCETTIGEVVDIEPLDGGFTVVVRDATGDERDFRADRVVLGLGSAPSRLLLDPEAEAVWPAECAVIDDPFEPGIADMLDRVRTSIRARAAARSADGPNGRVVIVGSNAGALDVIVNLMNDSTISAAIGRIDVVSMSGAFPELFTARAAQPRPAVACIALEELARRDSVLADDILEAVLDDIDSARRAGLTINDTFFDISRGFLALLDRLSPEEKMRFACDTGPRIGALQRKAGQDYRDAADRLIREGTLVTARTRFSALDEALRDAGQQDLLAVINCSGSERLSGERLRSPLIRKLLERALVHPSGSGLGISVTDDLETGTPGLYAIGPMLTGNVVSGEPTWNLEHCGRIAEFAHRLAAHLAERAFAGAPR